MKLSIVLATVLLASIGFAKEIKNSKVQIAASDIDAVHQLVNKEEAGVQKKINIVITDNGKSTDISPRYKVYLGYASLAEMGNLEADFLITNTALKVESVKRLEAGIYEVITQEMRYYDDGKYYPSEALAFVTYTIDTTKMFIDERKKIKDCGEDFCDGVIETSIKVTEYVNFSN